MAFLHCQICCAVVRLSRPFAQRSIVQCIHFSLQHSADNTSASSNQGVVIQSIMEPSSFARNTNTNLTRARTTIRKWNNFKSNHTIKYYNGNGCRTGAGWLRWRRLGTGLAAPGEPNITEIHSKTHQKHTRNTSEAFQKRYNLCNNIHHHSIHIISKQPLKQNRITRLPNTTSTLFSK